MSCKAKQRLSGNSKLIAKTKILKMDYQKMSGKFDPETKVWEGAKISYPVPMDSHMGELVIKYLTDHPKCVVQLSHDDGSEMTAEELRIKIIRVAQNLQKLGIQSEDVISVMCENSMDLIAFINGIVQIGAIANVFSIGLSKEDLLNLFKDLKPKLMLADASIYEKVKNVLNELNNKAVILVSNGEIIGNPSADELLKPTGREENYENMKFVNPQSKIVAILASSGSTGPPKGVCMSQAFFVKFLTIPPWDTDGTRSLTFSGVFWGSAFRSLFLSALTNHSRVVTKKPYTPETFIEMATKHKASSLNLNPPGWTLLLQSTAIHTFDPKYVTMVVSIGGIFTEELRKKMKKFFPSAYFMNLYGMTEITGAYSFPGQPIDGLSVGYVTPNHSMKIVDENGNSLGLGQTGEILIKFDVSPFLVSRI